MFGLRSRHLKTEIRLSLKTRVGGAISSFIKRLRVKERPVSETSDVIVCPLRFQKIFLWTENEPIQNPARWVILDDNRFSKELETFLRGTGEAKNTAFCMFVQFSRWSLNPKQIFRISDFWFDSQKQNWNISCVSLFISINSKQFGINFPDKSFVMKSEIGKTHCYETLTSKRMNIFFVRRGVGSHVIWRAAPNPAHPYLWNWFSPNLTSKME